MNDRRRVGKGKKKFIYAIKDDLWNIELRSTTHHVYIDPTRNTPVLEYELPDKHSRTPYPHYTMSSNPLTSD